MSFILPSLFHKFQILRSTVMPEKLPQPISNVCSLAILITCCLLICLIIVMNVLIDQPLFIRGINFIHTYQTYQPNKVLHVVQNLFSLLCNPIGVGAVFLVYYMLVNRKLMLMVHLSYFLFVTYIIALLKQAFQQSRPIWYDSRIENWEWFCPKDFGNPSGHSFAVMTLYEPIVSDTLGYGKYRLWVFPLVLLCIMVPISRMYLGVHSANQILFGLSMGFILLVLYKYIYQKALYELYWEMFVGPVSKYYLKLAVIVVLNLIVIAIPIIFYQVNLVQRPMLQKDIFNLNNQCGTNLSGKDVQVHMLTACSIGCVAFGFLYGFILLSHQQVGYRKYLLGLWVYETYVKVFIKIGIYVVSAAIPAFFFFAIASYVAKAALLKYFLDCLATMGGGFGLSYIAPKLTLKCKVMRLLPGYAEEYVDDIEEKMEQNRESKRDSLRN